jgi:hypothetical protein
MQEDKDIRQRPEAYPKPTETDHQLKNQDEYIQPLNNRPDDGDNEQPVLKDRKAQQSGSEQEGSGI